jgi:hypothetical protein
MLAVKIIDTLLTPFVGLREAGANVAFSRSGRMQ